VQDNVVAEKLGADHISKKHLADVKDEDFALTFPLQSPFGIADKVTAPMWLSAVAPPRSPPARRTRLRTRRRRSSCLRQESLAAPCSARRTCARLAAS